MSRDVLDFLKDNLENALAGCELAVGLTAVALQIIE